MTDLFLKNVRAPQGGAVDVLVLDGRIQSIGFGLAAAPGVPVEDGAGALLLPGLVEGHTHLDKTTWDSPWYVNEVGPALTDRIENERVWRARSGHDAASHSRALALAFLREGATRIRTHVDIDTDAGLRHLEGVHATRQELAGRVEIQTVAFPQSGLLIRPGTAELLDQALAQGADVLGGLDPSAIDRDPARSLDVLFGLADKHHKPVDIHLHEPGELGAFTLDLILDRVQALGMQGKVVISHAFCLGGVDAKRLDGLLRRLAALDVALLTTAPPSRPVPAVRACREAGVTIFGGNDGIRDTWTPYGSPDMLARAMLIGLRNDLRRDDEVEWAFDCVTAAAARACGFADYGLAPGSRADLVLVDASCIAQAVATRAPRRLVVSGGVVVARDGRDANAQD
ncbi:amidohydrolase family protein [Achromobacter xylosoxidans]|uniref:Cytosine deaminase n=1 Tax=Alcaligenes xylosoxydans xylosoxydans TaxID=85698 RepID=A0A424WIK1_ALCXX|nr:amidohydrolase family protein [Achromobacter xylosoxidans]MBC9903603.1 amidohydrolase family protein [Achromobacter xylosoxidans]MBD0866787.1 amidohydrolase family protein [Achromobacter xylosoxidans]QNP84854.1 amidohydrolase family protein [Achromobacter xylosoxidans]RPJ93022.1 cytosine deaminase [Achromobacter xylosoxidans]